MIEEITTNIVQCDGENCDEVYADVVCVQAESIAAFAKRDGWNGDGGRWMCPACRAAARLLAKANEASTIEPLYSAPGNAEAS